MLCMLLVRPSKRAWFRAAAWRFLRALKAIEKLVGANEDQTTGIKILARAIEEPLRQIVANAGEDAAVVLNRVREGKGTFGYNAATERIRRYDRNGHPGSDQGHASGSAERRLGCGSVAHDRGHDR